MEQQEEVRLHAGWYRFCLIVATLVFTGGPPFSQAQAPGKSTYDGRIYPRKNTFGIIGAYAWDSHRILLGDSERRMLLDFGVAYSRRILLTRAVNWQYDARNTSDRAGERSADPLCRQPDLSHCEYDRKYRDSKRLMLSHSIHLHVHRPWRCNV